MKKAKFVMSNRHQRDVSGVTTIAVRHGHKAVMQGFIQFKHLIVRLIMHTLLLIAGALMLSVGLVEAFRRTMPGAVCASYLGIVALWDSGYTHGLSGQTLLFWAIAVCIICAIRLVGGRSESDTIPSARYYIAGGSLAGMLAGFILGQAGMIVGAALGAVLGGMAWSRTPHGRDSMGSITGMIVTTGLPVTVVMVLIGLSIASLTSQL